jgi:hypothetical protein
VKLTSHLRLISKFKNAWKFFSHYREYIALDDSMIEESGAVGRMRIGKEN